MSTLALPHFKRPSYDLRGRWRRLRDDLRRRRDEAVLLKTWEREQRRTLDDLVGDLDIKTTRRSLRFAYEGRTVYARTLVVATRPGVTLAGQLEEALFGLGVDASVALHVDPISKDAAITMLNGQRTITSQVAGEDAAQRGFTDHSTEAGLVSAAQLGKLVYEGAEALFGLCVVLTLRAETEEALDDAERLLRTRWRGRIDLGSTAFQQRAGFLAAGVPYAEAPLPHRFTTNTTTLANLWPYLSKPVGTKTGARVAYALQDGLPVFLNPWQYTEADSEGWNAGHGIVPGPNGGGKTVFVWTLIVELLTLPEAPQVIVVDPVKGDLRKGVAALNGQIVSMSTRPDISLNPLDLPPKVYFSGTGEEAEQNAVLEQARLVTGLLLLMTRLTGDEDADSLIEQAVLDAYHAKGIHEDDDATWTADPLKVPLLKDVVGALPEAGVGATVRTRLNRWLTGTLSGLLSRPTNLNVSGRLISFDLERTDPRMKPVAVWLIANWVWQQAKRDRAPRLLYLEEVKTLLEVPETARMVAHLYSLGRAYKLAVVSATQLGTDYDETQEGRRARENAAWTLLMRQSKGAEWACAAYGLGESDKLFLETCPRGEGVLVTTGAGGSYGRVHVDPSPLTLELIGGPPAAEPQIGWEAA